MDIVSSIKTDCFEYEHGGVVFDAAMLGDRDDPAPQRPAVLVFHGIEGRTEAQEGYAARLARQGYLGVAVDLFGRDATNDVQQRRTDLTETFLRDRAALRTRLLHVLETVRSRPDVDAARVAAIGFCFGGLCAIDLARAGANVRAVASFHGMLTPPEAAPQAPISAKVLVCHGWADPFAPPTDLVAFGMEMTERGADWQVHAYGHAMHAFMSENANDPNSGICYNPVAAHRSWASLESFLSETLTP